MSVTDGSRTARARAIAVLAEVCHICHAGAIAPSGTGAWTMACALCRRIDRRLADDHGGAQRTPLWGGVSGLARPHLHATLMRDPTSTEPSRRLRAHHLAWCTAMAAAEGPELLVVDGEGVVAYQSYVRAVHPWIDSVEPRVADSRGVTDLLVR